MTEGFVKLWASILDSSVWNYDAETRIVWITLLAMADKDGFVHASIPGIANRAQVSLESAKKALIIFQKPDPYSRSKNSEGRRIEERDRDWFILNFEEHRARQALEASREAKRKWWNENRGKNALAKAPAPVEPPPAEKPKREKKVKADFSDDFLAFWEAYPARRKGAKLAALKAFEAAKRNGLPPIEQLIAILEKQKRSADWKKDNGEYIPMPASWLNKGRWMDEIKTQAEEEPVFLNA
jgi:hypothetical protein